jgi:L-seryl-tRNA(Ser) seleniumtransferase
MSRDLLKKLPSVHEVLEAAHDDKMIHHDFAVRIIKTHISKFRKAANSGKLDLTRNQMIQKIRAAVENAGHTHLKKVINGTGIVLHTGFGRAPISKVILKDLMQRLDGYVNLEFDLLTGKRGERLDHIEPILSSITGAEYSLLVNNNAAAVLLALNTISLNKEVIVSRGQEVEIGGSFRIPDIVKKSGCLLVEIGTTNRTHYMDYKNAITKNTGAILWVHTSNYEVKGFTKTVAINKLAELGKQNRIPVVADLGSGEFLKNRKYVDQTSEITVQDVITAGASVVSFSGDKLLGGAQAGLIVGKKSYLNKMKSNPLYRALRGDKLSIFLIEQILRTYRQNSVSERNLASTLLNRKRDVLRPNANKILSGISNAQVKKLNIQIVDSEVEAGSGSLPNQPIESIALKFDVTNPKASRIAANLRDRGVPVIGFISNSRFYLDLKAILKEQIPEVIKAVNEV